MAANITMTTALKYWNMTGRRNDCSYCDSEWVQIVKDKKGNLIRLCQSHLEFHELVEKIKQKKIENYLDWELSLR